MTSNQFNKFFEDYRKLHNLPEYTQYTTSAVEAIVEEFLESRLNRELEALLGFMRANGVLEMTVFLPKERVSLFLKDVQYYAEGSKGLRVCNGSYTINIEIVEPEDLTVTHVNGMKI